MTYCDLCSTDDIIHQSPGNLEPQHLKMLLSCLQTSCNPSDRCRILLTLGNAAAFTVNQVQRNKTVSKNLYPSISLDGLYICTSCQPCNIIFLFLSSRI